MGYYTYFYIDILKDSDNQTDDFFKDLSEKIELSEDIIKGYTFEAKWYNYKEDIKELSKKYPKLLIKIDGEGGDRFDNWESYFCNGECHHREMQFSWEHFDIDRFYIKNKK